MRIVDIHRSKSCVVSFELFPPKTAEAETKLFEQTVPELLALRPDFLTCTYGAGGSTRDKTLGIVSRIIRDFGVPAASHLTCVGASRDDITRFLDQAHVNGIETIVALRGDPPQGDTTFKPHPDGFRFASELVRHVKSQGRFSIAVAGYPEGHPETKDKFADWRHCAEKVQAGADQIMTQLFYDNNDFLAFEDHLRNRLGVKVPIIPGVLPILSAAQIKRFCGMCGSKLPPSVLSRLEQFGDDAESCRKYGVELATQMCDELIRHGVPGLHFYVLNRSDSTAEIMANLKLAPPAA